MNELSRTVFKSVKIFLVFTSLTGCATSLYLQESVYLTSPLPPEALGDDRYVFIAPYFAELKTKFSVVFTQPDPNKPGIVAITPIAVPQSRSYLYAMRNALFEDTITLKTNTDGLLTETNTTSKQQLTAIITEFAQTAAQLSGFDQPPGKPTVVTDPCMDQLNELGKKNFSTLTKVISRDQTSYRIAASTVATGENVTLSLHLIFPPFQTYDADVSEGHPGIVVFLPYSATVSLVCTYGKVVRQIGLTTQARLYMDSHYIDPRRDFLTNEEHAETLDAGFFSGQTYKALSAGKTIADTLTLPARNLLPSVSISNQVINVPGKADQITTTTTRATPKPVTQ